MICGDIHRLHRVRVVVPMPDDVDVRRRALHYAIDIVSLLWQTHGIHLAAHAADLAAVLPAIRVRVRPVDGGISRPLGMRRVGVGNLVADIRVITFGSGEAERLRVPGVSIIRALFETKMPVSYTH